MWDTRSIPGLGTGVVQRSWEALRGCARAAFDAAHVASDAVATTVHSADTHERLHHLLTGRRGRLIKIAFGLGIAGCLFVIAVSILWAGRARYGSQPGDTVSVALSSSS